ncbi:hypothetical protein [Undibacterium sp. TC9W]|uniref:hypothetical protein n=1 Tax=Undibacterium sp. TC9W TaxID=3413053 RepID=UPI003BF10875
MDAAFTMDGLGFREDMSVPNYKDDMIKMYKEKIDWKPGVKSKFDGAKDITFNLTDDFIDPLTTKAAN